MYTCTLISNGQWLTFSFVLCHNCRQPGVFFNHYHVAKLTCGLVWGRRGGGEDEVYKTVNISQQWWAKGMFFLDGQLRWVVLGQVSGLTASCRIPALRDRSPQRTTIPLISCTCLFSQILLSAFPQTSFVCRLCVKFPMYSSIAW